jgi:hypothetical protein
LSFRATPAKAGGDPESRIFRKFWIPAFAGMTEEMNFTRSSSYNSVRFPLKGIAVFGYFPLLQ